jgi:hypothetical protein
MPGPISDAYDPEWGTRANAQAILEAIDTLHDRVTGVLGGREPIDIRKLAEQQDELTTAINATLSEWEWRIIRFALERASDSI